LTGSSTIGSADGNQQYALFGERTRPFIDGIDRHIETGSGADGEAIRLGLGLKLVERLLNALLDGIGVDHFCTTLDRQAEELADLGRHAAVRRAIIEENETA